MAEIFWEGISEGRLSCFQVRYTSLCINVHIVLFVVQLGEPQTRIWKGHGHYNDPKALTLFWDATTSPDIVLIINHGDKHIITNS